MKIEFTHGNFVKQTIQLKENIAFLVGGSGSGKTQILKCLQKGLLGKSKNFFVNGEAVRTGQYQVIFLEDQFDLKEETKLSKTSDFRHQILKKINNLFLEHPEYKKVTDKISSISLDVGKLVNDLFAQNMVALTKPQIQLTFKTDKINLENIVDHLLEIHINNIQNNVTIDPKVLNRFLARMLIFNILLAGTNEEDKERSIVILFDGPEVYTNPRTAFEMNTIIKEMVAKRNFHFVFASNSAEYVHSFAHPWEKIHFLQKDFLSPLINLDQSITIATGLESFLLNDNYNNWERYWSEFVDIFQAKDLVQEKNYFYHNVFKAFFSLIYFADFSLELEINGNTEFTYSYKIEKGFVFLETNLKVGLLLRVLLRNLFTNLKVKYKLDSEQSAKTKIIEEFLQKE